MEEIENRNKELLVLLLKKINIDKSVKDMTDYKNVFVSVEYDSKEDFSVSNLKRTFLYASIEFIEQNGRLVKTNKKEILYNFGKKLMRDLSDNEIETTILELKLIASLVKQLKYINKIDYEESIITDILEILNWLFQENLFFPEK